MTSPIVNDIILNEIVTQYNNPEQSSCHHSIEKGDVNTSTNEGYKLLNLALPTFRESSTINDTVFNRGAHNFHNPTERMIESLSSKQKMCLKMLKILESIEKDHSHSSTNTGCKLLNLAFESRQKYPPIFGIGSSG